MFWCFVGLQTAGYFIPAFFLLVWPNCFKPCHRRFGHRGHDEEVAWKWHVTWLLSLSLEGFIPFSSCWNDAISNWTENNTPTLWLEGELPSPLFLTLQWWLVMIIEISIEISTSTLCLAMTGKYLVVPLLLIWATCKLLMADLIPDSTCNS